MNCDHITGCSHTPSPAMTISGLEPSRRRFLQWSALAAAAGFLHFPLELAASTPGRVRALALRNIRLLPSLFLDSVHTNQRYLMRLEPDRLLHNFLKFAGFEPKGGIYGGWENDTLSGHTLGHYLSALSLTYAQTGNERLRGRVDYIMSELVRIQADDGYVSGFYRNNDAGESESGRRVFEEVKAGIINAAPFNLNGCWAPFYTWHKLFAGLLDVDLHLGHDDAIPVLVKLAGYIEDALSPLDEEQMQKVLDTEFGGIGESLLTLGQRTNDERWIGLGKRFRHRRVVDPLIAQKDILPRHHANTQIPKLIAEARQFELTGAADSAAAARFFWETVTRHYSYVIGGNSDREYFQKPDTTADFLTESTCEHCNSYNMLKLTRHLYQWLPRARYFDYYERTLYNHTLSQQHPATGMFTYMTPMIAGGERGFSNEFDSFWCCVGSGMEAHAQYGNSIFWEDADTLYVNLYIPSRLDWNERGLRLEMNSGVPHNGKVRVSIREAGENAPRKLALRIPAWSQGRFSLKLNGSVLLIKAHDDYATLERRWQPGDIVELELEMPLKIEHVPGSLDTVSVLRGPLVLAADLGPVSEDYDPLSPDPALVAERSPLDGFIPLPEPGQFIAETTKPPGLRFVPFYSQYERRSAIYFRQLDSIAWQVEQARRDERKAAEQALVTQAVDWIQFGERDSEAAHTLTSDVSFSGSYRRRKCRDVRGGGFLEFSMKNAPGPLTLRLRYWGSDRGRYHILVNGRLAVKVEVDRSDVLDFVDHDYPLPPELMTGEILVFRFEPQKGDTAGPLFGGWLLPLSAG